MSFRNLTQPLGNQLAVCVWVMGSGLGLGLGVHYNLEQPERKAMLPQRLQYWLRSKGALAVPLEGTWILPAHQTKRPTAQLI